MSTLLLALGLTVGAPAELPTPEELAIRYPARDANDAAIHLEQLAAPIGINLVPRRRSPDGVLGSDATAVRPRPAPADVRALVQHYDAVHRYRQSFRHSPTAPWPAPAAVATFVETHGDALDTIGAHLRDAGAPRWERDDIDERGGVVLNIAGLWRLHGLLEAQFYHRVALGQHEQALVSLDSASRLGDAFVDRPRLLWVRTIWARTQLAMLRKVDAHPSVLDAIGVDRMRGAMLPEMIEVMAWVAQRARFDQTRPQFAGPILFDDDIHPWYVEAADAAGRWLRDSAPVRALLGSCLDGFVSASLEVIDRYRELDPCELATTSLHRGLRATTSWRCEEHDTFHWAGELDDLANQLGRAHLEAELTRLVLELRAARRESGAWPDALAAPPPCAGQTWRYVQKADCSIRLALEPGLSEPARAGLGMPLAFEAAP